MKDADKGCHNCIHRYGWPREFWKCSRTGYYTTAEMRFGGRCADGRQGEVLRLWSPRPSVFLRVIGIFRSETA